MSMTCIETTSRRLRPAICKNGHPRTPGNTLIKHLRNRPPERVCKACQKSANERWARGAEPMTNEEALTVLRHIAQGKGLRRDDGDSTGYFATSNRQYKRWLLWRKANPKISRRIDWLVKERRIKIVAASNISRGAHRHEIKFTPMPPSEIDVRRINGMVQIVDQEAKHEVIQLVVLDLLEGKCSYETLLQRANWHWFNYKYEKERAPASLDDADARLHEKISVGLWA